MPIPIVEDYKAINARCRELTAKKQDEDDEEDEFNRKFAIKSLPPVTKQAAVPVARRPLRGNAI